MAQRHVESLIGRMLTDDELRSRFLEDARGTLEALVAAGLDLTPLEVEALAATDRRLFELGASTLDPRIVKASLSTGAKKEGVR